MTDVKVFFQADKITKVSCNGHTGFGVEGEDIVCAALSSIVQTALLGLLTVAKIDVKFSRNDQKGILEFSLPDALNEKKSHDAQVILNTMLCGVSDLREGFSDFINLEVLKNVY